jgi:hypothetical protein
LSSERNRPPAVEEASFPPLQIQASDWVSSSDNSIPTPQSENLDDSNTQDIAKRSPVKTLRGILKKPRRYSKDARSPEKEDTTTVHNKPNDTNATREDIIPNVSIQQLDKDHPQPNPNAEPQTRVLESVDRSSYRIPRGSLQMAAFDRILFAKRGAELRDEYMREFVEGLNDDGEV